MLGQPEWWLVGTSLLLLGLHLWVAPPDQRELLPATVFDFSLSMSFENPDSEANIRTFLPANDERQFVMDEKVLAPNLVFVDEETSAGRVGRWTAGASTQRREIRYEARLSVDGVSFEIPADLPLPLEDTPGFSEELAETAAVQVNNPEIRQLWSDIHPGKATVLATLRAIHDFTTHEIEGAEFKGYTDALTALRLRQASCNGKSRLFVALARLNKLPARLVGGIILNSGSKKTSHQWVEVMIKGQWVPFDPLNDHFASIPSHYLGLYRGDEALFTHTSNINFDYMFTISTARTIGFETVSPVSGRKPTAWLPQLFDEIGLDPGLMGALLLFPVTALLISIVRNIVGISTFGVFLPMLVGAACRFTGLAVGLLGFFAIVVLTGLLRTPLRRLNLMQIPRISALVTIVTVLVTGIALLTYHHVGSQATMLVLFPVIIMSFTAERITSAMEHEPLAEIAKDLVSTTAMIILCFLLFSSMLLESLVLVFPELLLAVLGLQVAVGRWTGIRVTEFIRFRRLMSAVALGQDQPAQGNGKVLGMNARNRTLVQTLNTPELIATANDKILTKTLLAGARVTVARTLAIVQDYWDLQATERQLPYWFSFVIKPARGAKGQGIMVIHGRDGSDYITAGGEHLSGADLVSHMRSIIAGEFSMTGDRDEVLIESLIHPTDFYRELAPEGLCDIRVILVNGEALAAMLRVPTRESQGKANLHRGAIGVPIDIDTGVTGPGYQRGKRFDFHPENGIEFAGRQVPNWQRVMELSFASQRAIPLGFMGVDLSEDASDGPLVLEVNARPGLEIQNVQGKGVADLAARLAEIHPDNSGPEPEPGT